MRHKILTFGFLAVLFLISAVNLIKPQTAFSESENRSLALCPRWSLESLLDGKFTSEFEAYTTDQFIGRNGWVTAKTKTDQLLGRADNGQVYFGEDGYFFAMDVIDERQRKANLVYASKFLSNLQKEYPNISTSVLIAPTASQVLPEKLPDHAPVPDEEALIQDAEEKITQENPQTVFADPAEPLQRASKNGAYTYYRTDHHWTTDGAYIAYLQWAELVGLEGVPRDQFHIEEVSSSFYGTNHSKVNLADIEPDTIKAYRPKQNAKYRMTVELRLSEKKNNTTEKTAGAAVKVTDTLYDDSFLKKKDQYSYFLGGNNPKVTIETPLKNGRTLLVVKDSYAHCFIPFLANHFEKIVAVDLRYFKGGLAGVIDENKVTDVMLLYNVVQFSNDQNLLYMKL